MGKLIQSGSAMLVAGALLLSGLLVYALLFVDGGASSNPGGTVGRSGPIAEVAVFFPGPDDWADFRRGIALAASRGLGRVVAEADDAVIVVPQVAQAPAEETSPETAPTEETTPETAPTDASEPAADPAEPPAGDPSTASPSPEPAASTSTTAGRSS